MKDRRKKEEVQVGARRVVSLEPCSERGPALAMVRLARPPINAPDSDTLPHGVPAAFDTFLLSRG